MEIRNELSKRTKQNQAIQTIKKKANSRTTAIPCHPLQQPIPPSKNNKNSNSYLNLVNICDMPSLEVHVLHLPTPSSYLSMS